MIQIVADDDLVKSKLLDLINLTSNNGAFFHSDIKIIVEKGDLRLESLLDKTSREIIIHIPDNCLPRLDDYDVSINDGRFVFKERVEHTNKLQYEIFGLMLELFNHSNKISLHKQTFPWIIFRNNKEIIEHLSQGRSDSGEFYGLFKSGDLERLTIETYLGARHLYYSDKGSDKTDAVLLPIIDCVNHHTNAIPFVTGSPTPDDENGLMLRNSKPSEDSDECFARYNKADMLSSYMNYGFVDMSAIVLRSIPLTIEIANIGKIIVFGYCYHRDALRIPPEVEDIKYFFPDIKFSSKTIIEVSHLMIPPTSAADSLRRILEFLIKLLRPNLTKSKLKKLVIKCELQILQDNMKYYIKLDSLLNSRSGNEVSEENIEMLNQLMAGQRKKLSDYKKLLNKA